MTAPDAAFAPFGGPSPRQQPPSSPQVRRRLAFAEPLEATPDRTARYLRFSGVPDQDHGTDVLAEGAGGEQLPLRPTRLRASLDGADPSTLDELMELWICIADPVADPVMRVSLREMLTLGGERPLNLNLRHGEQVWIRLVGCRALWPTSARLMVEIA